MALPTHSDLLQGVTLEFIAVVARPLPGLLATRFGDEVSSILAGISKSSLTHPANCPTVGKRLFPPLSCREINAKPAGMGNQMAAALANRLAATQNVNQTGQHENKRRIRRVRIPRALSGLTQSEKRIAKRLMCPAQLSANQDRGFIIPIGGGEDRIKERQIHRRFVELSGGRDADIVVIPTASELESTGQDYNRIFRDLGAAQVDFLPISKRADCDNPRYLDMLDGATGIFLTGGNQLRLSTILGGTGIAQRIRKRNAAGVTVAGTSAGASIMSEHMIAGGDSNAIPAEGAVSLAPGLGLTNAVIIDQHFTQRNRLGRLLAASSYNPFLIGLGIDEDTAAFIGPNGLFEVVGSGTVTVVDASGLSYSSMWEASRGQALSLLGLKVDVMSEGCRYDLVGRQAYPPDAHAAFCSLPDPAAQGAPKH